MPVALRILFLVMVLGFLSGCDLQKKLLYYPDHRLPTDRELVDLELQYWPQRSAYRGFIGKPPDGKGRGTVVVFHGNADTADGRTYYVEPLRRLGYRVILAEYPAYGQRPGELGEKPFVEDARETLRIVAEREPGPVYLLGESLGAAVAAAAANGSPTRIAGLILVTPWDTLLSVAKEKFLWLPVESLMTDRYDTVANMAKLSVPVAVVMAERDHVVPMRHAKRLYDSIPGPKKSWTIRGGGHNDWPAFASVSLWEEIMTFVSPPL